MGATGRCRRLSERQGGMDYWSVLRCSAQWNDFRGHCISQDQSIADLTKPARGGGRGVLLVSLVIAIPKEAARARTRKHGRRLKGPEFVTARVFNRRNRSDGIGFLQQQ